MSGKIVGVSYFSKIKILILECEIKLYQCVKKPNSKEKTKFVTISIDSSMTTQQFLSSANEVSTGPTCQFLSVCPSVCVCVCLSGLFFKASNWIIYWLLTVVLATYLSD